MPQVLESAAPLGAAHGGAKCFHIFFRQRARHHLRIGDDMRGLAFSQQLASLRAAQLVSEADNFLSYMFQVRAHYNLVIIVYGSLVAALGIDYGNKAAVVALHI